MAVLASRSAVAWAWRRSATSTPTRAATSSGGRGLGSAEDGGEDGGVEEADHLQRVGPIGLGQARDRDRQRPGGGRVRWFRRFRVGLWVVIRSPVFGMPTGREGGTEMPPSLLRYGFQRCWSGWVPGLPE